MGLEEKGRMIAAREQQCADWAQARSRDEMARITATPDASLQSRISKETDERDRELAQCRARAEQEDAELYAPARGDYELQAQQERDRAALMMVLTTSRPH